MMWTERSSIGLTPASGLVVGGVPDVFSSVDTFQLTSTGKTNSNSNNNMLTNDQNNTNSLKERCSTARSRTISGDSAAKGDRYKTEMCRTFAENGSCRYGDKCQFAHGIADLRTVSRHPKYKTDLCRTFHSTGFCPYGTRCHFIHAMNEGKASEEASGREQTTSFIRSTPSLVIPPPTRRDPLRNMEPVSAEHQHQRPLNTVDLNANILAYLLQSMQVGQQTPQQGKSRPQLPALNRHPLSPTHSLDSAASTTSDHSTSPCPSPTDELFAFPGFPSYSAQQHLLSPGSAFSSSSDDSSPVWPTSLIPNLATPPSIFLPSHCQDSFETLTARHHIDPAGPLTNKYFVFA